MGKRGPTITTSPCPLCNQKPVRWGDAGCYKCGCRQWRKVGDRLEVVVRRAYNRRSDKGGKVDDRMGPDKFERLAG